MIEPDFTLPPIPFEEPERLAALHRLGVLDTPPEDELDVITRLAADRFDAARAGQPRRRGPSVVQGAPRARGDRDLPR